MARPKTRSARRGVRDRAKLVPAARQGPHGRRASRSALIFTLVLAMVLVGIVATTLAKGGDGDDEPLPAAAVTQESAPAQDDPSGLALRGVIDALPAASSVVELSRGRLATGAAWDLNIPGPALYGVEEGALGIRVDGPALLTRASSPDASSEEAAEPGVDYTLRPGDQILVLPDTPHLLRNDGRELTTYLSLVIFPAASAIPSWLPGADLPMGVELQRLAADVIAADAAARTGPIEIALDRTTISPSEDVPLEPTGFSLLVVESGTLLLGAGQAGEQEQRLDTGAVTRLEAGGIVVARNGGTEELKFLTVHIGSGAAGTPLPPESEASPSS